MKSFIVLITLLTITFHFECIAQDHKYEEAINLNSDLQIDSIKLSVNNANESYSLSINDVVYTHNVRESTSEIEIMDITGFEIIDLYNNDSLIEIAVYSSNYHGTEFSSIYSYSNNKITQVSDFILSARIDGNGYVYISHWQGFWMQTQLLKLDTLSRTLKPVEQEHYYVGGTFSVERSFTIYTDKTLKTELQQVRNNSKIEILICDTKNKGYGDYLYLIKTSMGSVGWCEFSTLAEHIILPMAG